MSRREFHFSEGTSNKFWAIELDGTSYAVHFGRIGTDGQWQTKEFSSADEAKKSYEKLIAEKVKKGYQEVAASAKQTKEVPAEDVPEPAKPAVPVPDEPRMFYREYWDPKTTDRKVLDHFSSRLSATVSVEVATLESGGSPTTGFRGKGWYADAGGNGDILEKYGLWKMDGGSVMRPSREALFEHLHHAFKKMEADGLIETDQSLSMRVFLNLQTGAGKFWSICVEGCQCQIHFGKAGDKHGRLSAFSGTNAEKDFSTHEEALAAYHQMIAKKLAEGYVELHQRETPYSTAPVPAPKPKKKGEPASAAEKPKPSKPPKTPELKGTAPVVTAAVNTAVTHKIDLDPRDWFWATWRKLKPLDRPEPRPFDIEKCFDQLVGRDTAYTYGAWERQANPNAPPMSRPEASFWFAAMCELAKDVGFEQAAQTLRKHKPPTELSASAVKDALKKIKCDPVSCLGSLISLLPAHEFVEVLLDKDLYQDTPHEAYVCEFMLRFHYEELPYFAEKELVALRQRVAREIDPAAQFKRGSLPIELYLAGVLGCHKELQALVASWPDSSAAPALPHLVIFGLGDAQVVEAEMRRLGLKLNDWWTSWTRAWLANTECSGLDLVRDCILEARNKEAAAKQLEVLALVKAPEAAELMLEISRVSKAAAVAHKWLATEVGNAVAGLMPTAAGRGKLANAAIDYLRDQKRQGFEAVIADCLKKAPAEVAAKVKSLVLEHTEKVFPVLDDKTTPPWLKAAVKTSEGLTPIKGADWLDPAKLPALVVGDRQLNPEQVQAVLRALLDSDFAKPQPLLESLKKNVEAESCDAFCWRLFELWLNAGGPSKQRWAMAALGLLGGDAIALKLTPLVRAWPGESQHARAVFGLECLRAIGSDTALMQLNGIAQKLKFQGLKNKAREFMEAIAQDKGLTKSELEDRIVPDCDLDERGSRVFDFGSRRFRLVLGPGMKPMVKDEEDKVKPDLPKPGAKDDTKLAEQAVADWKLLKKQVGEVAKIQAVRLEQAMVTGRRWPLKDFETLLVRHPLMINLVRLVVWGGYDKKGELARTFRVTEDQTYADAKDQPCKLQGLETVGIVHPLHLSDAERGGWGEVLGDYEIIPPFAQLGRPTYALEKDEKKQKDIKRFDQVKLPAPTLVFGLEKLGWVRGRGMDAGAFDEHSKPFPSANVTAVVKYEGGVGMGYISPDEMLPITECYFVKGMRGPSGFEHNEKRLGLDDVDPIVISEVLSDLTALAAKGKE
jgi:predicted DNA-binding WGR domain protein